MEQSGHVIEICPLKEGQTAKGHWSKQVFAIEQKSISNNTEYVTDIAFSVFNAKCAIPAVGTAVKVSFSSASRKYNDNWYTENTAFKIEVLPTTNNHPTSVPLNPASSPAAEKKNEDLPF